MNKFASLIAVKGNEYLMQIRDVKIPGFTEGKYPFIFPGTASFFGGEIEENETPKEGFERELNEELPGLKLDCKLTHRKYNWEEDLLNVLEAADNVFHGNTDAFLGFDLHSLVPDCAAGKYRGQKLTYAEFIKKITEDHFYIAEFQDSAFKKVKVREGSGKLWVPHDLARSLVMVPSDKLALLDDISRRVLDGEFEI